MLLCKVLPPPPTNYLSANVYSLRTGERFDNCLCKLKPYYFLKTNKRYWKFLIM